MELVEMAPRMPLLKIALRNLLHRKFRTAFMAFFVFAAAASLCVCSVLKESMRRSLDNTISRMGADIVVAPKDVESSLVNSLFLGEVCNFSFDRSWMEKIAGVDGVERITHQLYIATLEASCCLQPTQIVAFDPGTDFIVRSWLTALEIPDLQDGQVIIGSEILAEKGDLVKFFGVPLQVAGVLARTGTGCDNRVYLNFSTASRLMSTPEWNLFYPDSGDSARTSASVLMIRAKEGEELRPLAMKINYSFQDFPLKASTASGIFSGLSDSMRQLSFYGVFMTAVVFFLVIMALICVFTITIHERRHEFGVLSALGATRAQLVKIILAEASLIGIAGGLSGCVLSLGSLLIFQNLVTLELGIPSLVTSLGFLAATGLRCVALSLLASLGASLWSAVRIGRQEPIHLIQGDE